MPGNATSYSQLLNSTTYRDAVDEVRRLGGNNDYAFNERTPEQTQIAWFWSNDPNGTYKPPGQLLEHTKIIAGPQNRNLSQDAKADLFAQLGTALADASIAAWDTKYLTSIDLWRPVNAVNNSNPGANWRPLADDRTDPPTPGTPCFPAWVSGHAAFAGAWAGVLRQFFDTDNVGFTATTDDPQAANVTRTMTTLTQAARENAISRIYLGVHYRVDGDLDGLNLGENVADKVVSQVTAPRIEVKNSLQGDIFCQLPYLGSDFGPLAHCTQLSGGQARSGLFSPLTKQFDPGAWESVVEDRVTRINSCRGTDGQSGTCVGYPVVNTTFGGASRATQYQSNRARIGWYNVVTGQFYPDAGGPWFPL